jgi:hypothetical protein
MTHAQPYSDHRGRPATIEIEIEVQGRWDALALSELLIPFHSYLVHLDQERWVVHAHAPGARGESLSDALAAVDDWRIDRQPRAASCRVGGRPYDIHETTAT